MPVTVVHFELQSTGVEAPIDVPRRFALYQNMPNPFNPNTRIRFDAPTTCHVLMELYDVTGRKMKTLVDKTVHAGPHHVELHAADLTSGLYIYRVEMGTFTAKRKLMIIQ